MPGGETMQAIYEGCYEYTRIQGMFAARGDGANWDWEVGDLTQDNAWHDLDLSGIVPEHAKVVLFTFSYSATNIGIVARFRQNGIAQEIPIARRITLLANISHWTDLTIPVDTNRIIEYKFPVAGFTTLNLRVIGWWY